MVTAQINKQKMLNYYISRCNSELEKGDTKSAKMFYTHSRQTLIGLLKGTQSTELKREHILEFNEKIQSYAQSKGIQSPAKTYIMNLQTNADPLEQFKESKRKEAEFRKIQKKKNTVSHIYSRSTLEALNSSYVEKPLELTSEYEIPKEVPLDSVLDKSYSMIPFKNIQILNEIYDLEEKETTPNEHSIKQAKAILQGYPQKQTRKTLMKIIKFGKEIPSKIKQRLIQGFEVSEKHMANTQYFPMM